jgi:hypothetical protein
MNPSIGVLRILQISFIVSVLLFIYVLQIICPSPQIVDTWFQWTIVCCAIASALTGFIMQSAILKTPDRPNALGQMSTPRCWWFTGHTLRFATAEFVALFGFVLRTMGSYSNAVIALFAGSLLLLTLWQPGEIPTPIESQNPIR